MKHRGEGPELDDVYRRIGELVYLHNCIDDVMGNLIAELHPVYLRSFQRRTGRSFEAKRRELDALAQTHGLLSKDIAAKIRDVCRGLDNLNRERNRLVHAVERWEWDPVGNNDDFSVSYVKDDRVLDTSPESIAQVRDSFIERLDDLDSVRREAATHLASFPDFDEDSKT